MLSCIDFRTRGWEHISGGLDWISSGAKGEVWGTSRTEIWKRHGISSGRPSGTGWTRVGGSLKQVDVFSGQTWGVSTGQEIFYTWRTSRMLRNTDNHDATSYKTNSNNSADDVNINKTLSYNLVYDTNSNETSHNDTEDLSFNKPMTWFLDDNINNNKKYNATNDNSNKEYNATIDNSN